MQIEELTPAGWDGFLAYLNDHLSDNGRPVYFQPLPRDSSAFPADKAAAFQSGLQIAVGAAGWRRVWVARDAEGAIGGHIDLRAHAERHAGHRCLLGMGVDRSQRQRGLGGRLLAHPEQWARDAGLAWLDLQVLSTNSPAIALYRRSGFQQSGEIADMFRIDGLSFGYTNMSKPIA